MSTLTLVIGKSGRGKTTALRYMPPDQTFLFNVMGKALPFLGATTKYIEGKNMQSGAEVQASPTGMGIIPKMADLNKNRPDIKNIVVDDAQYIMATEFMRQALVKGYEKFTIMAQNMWNLLVVGSKLRNDVKVFVLTHEEETVTERKMKTLGKLLDEKLTPEGLATIVLFADTYIDDQQQTHGYFQTQSDGVANAKSPIGMFPLYIENDLWKVSQRIDEYYAGVELQDSKIDFGNVQIKKG